MQSSLLSSLACIRQNACSETFACALNWKARLSDDFPDMFDQKK